MRTHQSHSKKENLPSSSLNDNLLPSSPLEENLPSDSLKDRPVICPVCLNPILVASDTREGQQSIFCESICNSWLHRQCAGLSEPLFNKYATIEDPFYCPHCRLITQDSRLQELKATVESLAKEVMALKCTEAVVVQPNPELCTSSY